MNRKLKYCLCVSVGMILSACGGGGDDSSSEVKSISNSDEATALVETSENFYAGKATLLTTSYELDSLAYIDNNNFWSVQRSEEIGEHGNSLSSFTSGQFIEGSSPNLFYDHKNTGLMAFYQASISNKDDSKIITARNSGSSIIDDKVIFDLKPSDNLRLYDINGLIGSYNGEIADYLSAARFYAYDDTKNLLPATLNIEPSSKDNELIFDLRIASTSCYYTGEIKPYSLEEKYFFKLDAELNNCPEMASIYEPITSITGNIIKDDKGIVLTGLTERKVLNIVDASSVNSFLFIGR